MTSGQFYRVRALSPDMRVFARAAFVLFLLAMAATIRPAPAAVFDPHSFTLDNGLQVVVIENHRSPVVRQTVFYKVGSADDPYGKSGLAHYLEHLMFKGTRELAPNEFSRIVARNGGRDNAYTSYDTTAYYQTIARDRLEIVMKHEADRMANLQIDPKEAVPELQVVIEERRLRTDNRPAAQFEEHMSAALYLHYPYRVPVIGWRHEIEGLTVEDAMAFYERYYAPNNAVLIIAGDVTVDEVRPLVEKYYGPIPANPDLKARTRVKEPPHRAARRVVFRNDRVSEPQLRRDYLAPSRGMGETATADALEVLAVVLGGGTTNRLYRSLVVEQQIALAADAYYNADMLGPSAFSFALRPAPGVGMAQLEAALDAEIAKILEQGITEEELTNARNRMLAAAIFARGNLRRGVSAIGTALTTGQTIDNVETWPARIEALTADNVADAAKLVLNRDNAVTGELLPARPDQAPKDSNGDTGPTPPAAREITR